MLGQRPREDLLELLEGGRQVRVVLVRVADHQPRGQHDGHGLGQGQLERRQELVADHAPLAVFRPDGDPDDDRGDGAIGCIVRGFRRILAG